MGSEVIILPVLFGVIFAIIYLYLSTRHKERLALIEKGAEASIFVKGKRSTAPFWKVLLLNLSLLLMGIGLAIFLAAIIVSVFRANFEVAYPGTIFLMSGIGLYIGFNLTKKLEKED